MGSRSESEVALIGLVNTFVGGGKPAAVTFFAIGALTSGVLLSLVVAGFRTACFFTVAVAAAAGAAFAVVVVFARVVRVGATVGTRDAVGGFILELDLVGCAGTFALLAIAVSRV